MIRSFITGFLLAVFLFGGISFVEVQAQSTPSPAPATSAPTGTTPAAKPTTVVSPKDTSDKTGGYSLDDAWHDLGYRPAKEVSGTGGADQYKTTHQSLPKPKHLVGVNDTPTGDASDATRFLQRLAKGLMAIFATVAVFFVVYNALYFVISAGDSDKITKAKKAMTWIALGLLLVIFAYVLVKTIISLPFSGS